MVFFSFLMALFPQYLPVKMSKTKPEEEGLQENKFNNSVGTVIIKQEVPTFKGSCYK